MLSVQAVVLIVEKALPQLVIHEPMLGEKRADLIGRSDAFETAIPQPLPLRYYVIRHTIWNGATPQHEVRVVELCRRVPHGKKLGNIGFGYTNFP